MKWNDFNICNLFSDKSTLSIGDQGCHNKKEEKELCKHHTCGYVPINQQPRTVSIQGATDKPEVNGIYEEYNPTAFLQNARNAFIYRMSGFGKSKRYKKVIDESCMKYDKRVECKEMFITSDVDSWKISDNSEGYNFVYRMEISFNLLASKWTFGVRAVDLSVISEDEWSECSKTCGRGIQTQIVPDSQYQITNTRYCNRNPCPKGEFCNFRFFLILT